MTLFKWLFAFLTLGAYRPGGGKLQVGLRTHSLWFPKPIWARPSKEEWAAELNRWFTEPEAKWYLHYGTWRHEMMFYFTDEKYARRFAERAMQLWPALTSADIHFTREKGWTYDQHADCWHNISELQWCSNCDEFVGTEYDYEGDDCTMRCVDCGEDTITIDDMTPKEAKKRVDAWIKTA